MPRRTASSSLPCRRALAAGSMSPCRWALLDALDQSHFEGLEGPAGAIGHGGVLPGQLGGAIREQAAEVPGVARGSVRYSQDVRTQSRVSPVVGPSERPPRRLGHLGAVPIEHPQVELALVAEGAVEAALAQACRRRDLVDARPANPLGQNRSRARSSTVVSSKPRGLAMQNTLHHS
jgi:hypothetical protein